jgi:hypothetical protein
MAIPKITGAQRDFSAGELDVSMKRSDENPLMKIGARQLANYRVLNSGAVKNRPGRTALFPETGRVEKVLMSPGNIFYLAFGNGYLRVYNAVGTRVFSTTVKGDGATAIPWTTATVKNVVWALGIGVPPSIYIAYADGAPNNVPQILSWDGVSQTSTWTLSTYAETVTAGGQKRTPFYRIAPPNIVMQPSASTGAITFQFSAPVLVAGMVGTRIRYVNRQILITGVTDSEHGSGTVEEPLPGMQIATTSTDPRNVLNVGDEIEGTVSGATGIVVLLSATTVNIQLLNETTTTTTGRGGGPIQVFAFVTTDVLVGPGGSVAVSSMGAVAFTPNAIAVWDQEVMNAYQGYPSSVFVDQGRLGFCNFPSVLSGIAWSAIGLPTDLYPAPLPDNSIFELAPGKSQVLFVLPGMESSEFVFCDNAVYYIPITVADPLEPGSVAFNLISQQGCAANVKPQPAEQSILYMKAGGVQVGAVQAPGAYYRPYVIDNVSEFHSHLFTASPAIAIAVPSATSQFEELYAYILLANGNIVTGKYGIRQGLLDVGPEGKPKIGWLPWTGAGTVEWISAQGPDLIFTTSYAPNGRPAVSIVEALDNTQYVDGGMLVNAAPAAFAPPAGKGPMWWLPGGSVTLMDQSTRMMGTYQIDSQGNIIPQGNAGENLASAQLMAGQPWTATLEPFVPDAPPGQSVHQRMFKRRVSRMAVYVSSSSGFVMARLFAGPLTRTSPALGTIMNTRRVETWNQDDDPTQPPPLREEAQRWRPRGRAYDPRVAVIKDTPGPLELHEIGLEASI